MIVEATNQARALANLPPLKSVVKLADCAREHSREMCELNYFDHKSPTPGMETPRDRVQKLKLNAMVVGENIYMSSGNPAAIVEMSMAAWMKSPGHRANILKPEYTCIGVGLYAKGQDVYVTQVFSSDLSE